MALRHEQDIRKKSNAKSRSGTMQESLTTKKNRKRNRQQEKENYDMEITAKNVRYAQNFLAKNSHTHSRLG